MFVQIALSLFAYLVLRHIRQHIGQLPFLKQPNPLSKLLQHWNGQDRIFKLIQNGLILVAGLMDSSEMYVIDHARMIIINNISNAFAFLRKITRFPQTRHILANVRRQMHKILNRKCQRSRVLQQALGLIADGFNCIYFFCDHYMALCIMSVFTDFDYLYMVQFWFSAIWLMSSVFAMLKDFAMLYRHVCKNRNAVIKLKKVKSDDEIDSDEQYYAQIDSSEQQEKFKKHLLLDFSKNLIDIITNFAAMYPAFLAKKSVGLLGMAQSILWMIDYLRVHG